MAGAAGAGGAGGVAVGEFKSVAVAAFTDADTADCRRREVPAATMVVQLCVEKLVTCVTLTKRGEKRKEQRNVRKISLQDTDRRCFCLGIKENVTMGYTPVLILNDSLHKKWN
jgi:hypothetical protein